LLVGWWQRRQAFAVSQIKPLEPAPDARVSSAPSKARAVDPNPNQPALHLEIPAMADAASPELRDLYRERRASSPILYDERARLWFVYRYDDVKEILADWHGFSCDYGAHLPASPLAKGFDGMLIGLDPPRHTKLRALVSRAFTPRSVADLAPQITTVVRGLIHGFKDRGACELVEEFAGIVPVLALADLLGVPGERHVYFRDLAQRVGRMFDAVFSGQPVDRRPQEELDAYFTELLEERRRSPREDIISRLLAAEVDGERLAPHEMLGFCKLLLVAGIGTSARLIATAVATLLQHPAELAKLRANMSLMPSAIEEVLRFRPPVNAWFRVSAKDIERRGQKIPAQQQIILMLGSANRDEACFADPDRFDITRDPNPHVAFGNGIHYCVGAPLARLQARVALTALFTELPDLSFASDEPLVALPGIQANGFGSLPLRFGAGKP
jgi:cytochrome P450